MVSIKHASINDYINASTSETAQTVRAAAAALLVEVGATATHKAIPVRLLGHKLSKYASLSTVYRLLKDSPGFVPEYSMRGKLGYWFEQEAMKPYARQQKEPHYPSDLAAIAIDINGGPVGTDKPEPLFEVTQAPVHGNYLVPARAIEPDQYSALSSVLEADIKMLAEPPTPKTKAHIERAISLLLGYYVNEYEKGAELE